MSELPDLDPSILLAASARASLEGHTGASHTMFVVGWLDAADCIAAWLEEAARRLSPALSEPELRGAEHALLECAAFLRGTDTPKDR